MELTQSLMKLLHEAAAASRISFRVVAPRDVRDIVVEEKYIPMLIELIGTLPEGSKVIIYSLSGKLETVAAASPERDVEAILGLQENNVVLKFYRTLYNIKQSHPSPYSTSLLLPIPEIRDAVSGRIDSDVLKSLLVGIPWSYATSRLPDSTKWFINEITNMIEHYILPERFDIMVTPPQHRTLLLPGGVADEDYVAVSLILPEGIGVIVYDREHPRTYIISPSGKFLESFYIYERPLEDMFRDLEIEVYMRPNAYLRLEKSARRRIEKKFPEVTQILLSDLDKLLDIVKKFRQRHYLKC